MFRRREKETDTDTTVGTGPAYTTRAVDVVGARGGVSASAVLTGVVVALGALFLLTALVAGIIVASGYELPPAGSQGAIDAGLYGVIALVLAQLFAYIWGGYTAGRMARGAGAANGILVPAAAIVLVVLVGGIATALGANASFNLPFETSSLPLGESTAVDWGIGVGIASLLAMFLGAALGGALGARWHTVLEDRAVDEGEATYRNIDLTDRDGTAAPPPPAAASASAPGRTAASTRTTR